MRQIVEGAHRSGTPVSVCGEMAGDPLGLMAILGMGIDSLSMSVGSLLRAKKVIMSVSMAEMATSFNEVITMTDSDDIREYYTDYLNAKGLGGLIRAGK